MEGLGIVANAFAIVSIAIQLGESCIKLYNFWESMEDAPHQIGAIKEDLEYLISVFKKVEDTETPLGDCITEGIKHCRSKVADLVSIVESLDSGFQSNSRRKRLRTAFRAAIHDKHVQRFRESLDATKSTLTLAMVHECVAQLPIYNTTVLSNTTVNLPITHTTSKAHGLLQILPNAQTNVRETVHSSSTTIDDDVHSQALIDKSHPFAQDVLSCFEKEFTQQALAKCSIHELMLHAICQSAVASFKSTSLDILAQDSYATEEYGYVRSKTIVYSDTIQHRVHHQAYSFRTALGCLWIRKTSFKDTDRLTGKLEQSQTVTSVNFYPASWLQIMGIRNGFEAIAVSAGRSWLYNCRLTVTRPVPEDSPIFELCLAGELKAVQILLERGQSSVVDTSPKGWKPLHFAAYAGHIDLCKMLIDAGADRSALVYEGPTESILSPISLFVSNATSRGAEDKIAMLRLFCDCIDISAPDADGWNVHEWLKKAYATERRPISQNSITWLLHMTANEQYVEICSRNLWHGIQHATRSILNHAKFSNALERILNDMGCTDFSKRHVNAISAWLALRVEGRVILPMCVNAGSFLQMKGFDWVDDGMPHRQFLQAIPNIYAAWCRAVLDAVDNVETYMRDELAQCLEHSGMTQAAFLDAISSSNATVQNEAEIGKGLCCTDCDRSYSSLDNGLVEPATIAIRECTETGHSFDCACQELSSTAIDPLVEDLPLYTATELPAYDEIYHECNEPEPIKDDEEFFDAQPYLFSTTNKSDPFSDIARVLYRAQGRVWLGCYTVGERLCGTCFLLREKYIDEDGLAADFPPPPKSFEGIRVKW